ncbi:MAG: magnesium and cobalt exporter, family [Candidatus Sumerlaeota bacterium]|nr:magnesium and cobalt exporter, family [Candidatus Sumerlaeota bacterium]
MLAIFIVTALSVIFSFLCSLMEAAFYSITPSKIEEMRSGGDVRGIRLARLRLNVDEPIAAILSLNTIANTLGATLGGSLVGRYYAENGSIASAVYGLIFTVLVLYISEIVPKTLGVTYADRLAPAFSAPLLLLIRLMKPFVVSSQVLTQTIRKGGPESGGAPSEREILALAEMGARAGTLLPDEARWAINALRLNDVIARDLMTPRTVVYVLPVELPLAEVAQRSEHWTYSRLPVVRDNDPDQVEGIVHRRDVFDELVTHDDAELEGRTLKDLAQAAHFVPETLPCNELLRMFLENRQQLLIVTNEFGGMEGVISLEDILEYILGEEIVDPHDKHIDMQEVARRKAERRQKQRAAAGSLGPKRSPRGQGRDRRDAQ